MTEERIIRVTKVGLEFLEEQRYDPTYVIAFWHELEPAPPKNWRPLCFDENTGANEEYCNGVHETNWMGYIQKELEDNCRKCPYRLQGGK